MYSLSLSLSLSLPLQVAYVKYLDYIDGEIWPYTPLFFSYGREKVKIWGSNSDLQGSMALYFILFPL